MKPRLNLQNPVRTVGVLGCGQLAMMLCESIKKLGARSAVFGSDRFGPAAHVCDSFFFGEISEPNALHVFLEHCDVVVFENEFVDCHQLLRALQKTKTPLVPRLDVIATLQNKLFQKLLMRELQIPTGDFIAQNANEPASAFVERARSHFGHTCVLKFAQFGYDGNGVFVVSERASKEALEAFILAAENKKTRLYAEAFIPFTDELAIVVVRSETAFVTYPLVLSQQKESICYLVRGPATAFGVKPALESEAQEIAKKLANHLGINGAFAIEFFVSQDGRLLANEIAPRVHNSGHFSQDACEASQFENHVRAACGLALKDPNPQPFFAMVNVLGETSHSAHARGFSLPSAQEAALHWYHKHELRPRRKLGHFNLVARSASELESRIKAVENSLTSWNEALSRLSS